MIQNSKLKTQNSNRQGGFTLVELLAVILVIGVVGGVVGGILISSLIGTNKTNSLESVRQNGNYALLQISKSIEFSRSFGGVSLNGVNYITDCTQPQGVSPTPTPVPYFYIKITSNDGNDTVFSCFSSAISSNSASLSSNSASLVNPSTIAVSSCYFTCSQDSLVVPPTIGIGFTLSDKKAGNFVENKTSVPFQTSVTLRNLNR